MTDILLGDEFVIFRPIYKMRLWILFIWLSDTDLTMPFFVIIKVKSVRLGEIYRQPTPIIPIPTPIIYNIITLAYRPIA